MNAIRSLLSGVFMTAALVACSPNKGVPSPPSAAAVGAERATKPATYPGETAATIAGLIKECTDVTPGAIAGGGDSGMTSTASCLINGRKVWIDSYASAEKADPQRLLEANKAETYYVIGNGWVVTSDDNPSLHLQLTNQAGELIKQQLAGFAPPPPDLPGQRSSMEVVVTSIGGKLHHVSSNGTTSQ